MRRALILSLLVSLSAGAAEFHVSPQGDDAAVGSSERPFRSLARARDAARTAGEPARIVLADGLYVTDDPLVFTAEDRHLEIVAADGARPVVSAGRRLTGWRVDAKGVWHASVPKDIRFAQFYVNGERRTRPFLPRKSYYFVEKAGGAEPETNRERFICRAGDFPSGDNPDLEVCLFHTWTMSRSLVVSYVADTRLVTLGIPFFKPDYSAVGPERWYRFDNVKSAFGEPGDWYLDAAKGEVLYAPRPGEEPDRCETIASRHRHAVFLEGSEDVVFRGVTFAHADYGVRTNGNYIAQAAADQPGAVQAEAAKGVRLEDCAVAHTGAYGVRFTRGCEDCAVVRCELFDLGAGGVAIGHGWEKDRSLTLSRGCTVEDCIIEGGGRVDPAGVGVWIGHAKENRVAHNTIHDLYYSGISAGWNWSLRMTARDNILEWNHIYDIGQHVLSDMGGIYLLGRQPGTVERYNHIHHVTRARNCAFGVYFDSGTAEVCVSNCVVHDCGDSNWFMARISASNRVENNVFAYGPRHQLNNPPRDPVSSPSLFARNLLVWDDGLFMPDQPGPEVVDYADNLYSFPEGRGPKSARGFSFAEIGFADAARRDFRLKDETATRSVGFVPFSIEGCGRRSPRRFTREGQVTPPVFFAAPDRPPVPVAENFEALPTGGSWTGWHVTKSSVDAHLVKVTDETAARGRKSLEVVDSQAGWIPHFYQNCVRKGGLQRILFSLKVERGAQPQFEARNYDSYPADGPRPMLRVSADGFLFANGQKLLQVPFDVWFDVGLEFELGKNRTKKTFDVRVRLPGDEKPRVFAGQALGPNFTVLDWVGFTSNAAEGQRYWIDDFRLKP